MCIYDTVIFFSHAVPKLWFFFFLHYTLQVAAYDTVEKKMAFFDPSRAKDFLFISGTKVGKVFSDSFP